MSAGKDTLGSGDTLLRGTDTLVNDGGQKTTEIPGRLIGGRYELLGLLGAGGMGSVYRVRDTELDEIVALKMLQRELVSSPDMIERFRREVKLARRVTHPNVARMFDIGEDGGEKFLTMELVDGEPLSRMLHEQGPLPLSRAVPIISAICQGLAAAHAAGVVHRDLKPDNILLARDGRVVITDFGIAGAIDAGAGRKTMSVVGTPAYMAPEQVEGVPTDCRADIYALGIMLFEMLTGTLPWDGPEPYAVALARLLRPPPDPRERRADLPEPLALLVLRCLARDPAGRFAGAGEVAAALSALTLPLPAATPAAGAPPLSSHAVPAPSPSVLLTQTPHGAKSVAVLPLRNLGPPDDDYLADGFTEELIDNLSMVSGLRVRPRGAVIHLKGAEADPRELGERLGVQVIVEGSLRRLPDRVRIQIRLVSVSDGFQLWARRFDRPVADVLVVSDEAARAIADALTVQAAAPARERGGPGADGRAIDLYLQARHEYHKGDQPSITRALALYRDAVALLPDDPTLLSGYALASARAWFFGNEGAGELAREVAARALQLAPERGEAHLAQAIVSFHSGDQAAAVGALQRARALSPALGEVHDLLGRILIETGPLDEGIKRLQTAIALDPNQAYRPTLDLARAYALSGRLAEAERMLDGLVFENPGMWLTRARLCLWRGDAAGAQGYLDRTSAYVPNDSPVAVMLKVSAGQIRGLATSAHLTAAFTNPRSSDRSRVFFFQMRAETAAALGEPAYVLDALEQAVAAGLPDLMWLDHCPLFQTYRTDPRFVALRERVAARAEQVVRALHGA